MFKKNRSKAIVSILISIIILLAIPSHQNTNDPMIPNREASGSEFSSVAASTKSGTLYVEDFEDGFTDWSTDSNWSIVYEGMNAVAQGTNHAWMTLNQGSNWTDYTFDADVKIISDAVQLMFRLSDDRGRYIIGITPSRMYLSREYPWEKIEPDLANYSIPTPTNTWNHVQIVASLKGIDVYLNGILRLSYQDSWDKTLWQGSIGLEVTPDTGAQARFDNIEIYGVIAPEADWVKTGGPVGGLGYDVRYGSSTQVMYVTDNYSGVSKSQDGGKTWFASNRGITGRFGVSGDAIPVFTLTVDPNNPDIIWAGLKDAKGLYKSVNAGQIWVDVTPPITEPQFVFRGVTIQQNNSNIVYAQGELPMNDPGLVHDKVKGRIYRTEDGGLNWTMIWEGDNLVRYVFIHPENNELLFASLGIFDREAYDSNCGDTPPSQGTGGILKLTREGSLWNNYFMNNGLTDMYVGTLAIHPTKPNIMLAGAGNTACSRYEQPEDVWHNTGGAFLTTDGGESWSKTLAGDIITSVEFSPTDPDVAYAGGQHKIYRSEDGGWNWDPISGEDFAWGPVGAPAGFPIDFLIDQSDPATIFSNNYGGGNTKSTDGGVTWDLASDGYTGALMLDVAVNPDNSNIVYGTARSGVFRSINGGKTWQGLSTPPTYLASAYGIAIKPDEPNVIIVSDELLGNVYRSTNGGLNWTKVFTIPNVVPGVDADQHGFKSIEFAAEPNSNIVYAGACRGSVALDDIFNNDKKLSKGVFKSVDGGVTWNKASDSDVENKCLTAIAIHPTNPNIVYAAAPYAGVYKTVDGGVNWTLLSGIPTVDIRSVEVDPANPNIVYVGALQGGVYRSTNGGSTWVAFKDGMEPNDPILDIVIDPTNQERIWAASRATGIYLWLADEDRWSHVNGGLFTRSIQSIDISSNGQVLYAATSGEGVFRLGEVTSEDIYLPLITK